MPVWPSLPIEVHTSGLFFPFTLASQVIIDWEFSVDAVKTAPLTGPDSGTRTTTLSGSGSGTITVLCDTRRFASGDPTDMTPGTFIVTRKLSYEQSDAALSQNFRLWLALATGAGSYSIDQLVEDDYDDPLLADTSNTYTDADDAAVIPLVITIGATTVEVTDFAIGSQTNELALALWLPPDAWTFDRADLFTAQTFTASATAGDLGYDSGTGWDQSVTFTLSPWVY